MNSIASLFTVKSFEVPIMCALMTKFRSQMLGWISESLYEANLYYFHNMEDDSWIRWM